MPSCGVDWREAWKLAPANGSASGRDLTRELQMRTSPPVRGTTKQRRVRWDFEELSTLRRTIIQRAGCLVRPQGRLTLIMAPTRKLKAPIERFMN